MDSISKVYWGDMKDEYPSDIDGYDRKGRPGRKLSLIPHIKIPIFCLHNFFMFDNPNLFFPVATVNIGLWNVRRAVLTGQMPRLKRYILRLFELGKDKVIEMQYQGKNVTQLKVLMNLDGFNPVQHGCPLCKKPSSIFSRVTERIFLSVCIPIHDLNHYFNYPGRYSTIHDVCNCCSKSLHWLFRENCPH